MNKKKKIIIVLCIIMLLDILILPYILNIIIDLIENGIEQHQNIKINCKLLSSINKIFIDDKFQKLFLSIQPIILIFTLCLFKNSSRTKINNLGMPNATGNGEFGTARWQTENEKDINFDTWKTSDELDSGGIILGMKKYKKIEKIWMEKDDSHSLIIGATRSGKSRKIILPTIWELAKAEESMIISDPKGELYISTKEYLENEKYNIICINLREPQKGNQWNLLNEVNKAVKNEDIAKATELAWDIANTIVNQNPESKGEPIWENGEQSTIACLILLTALESSYEFQKHMTTAYYLLAQYGCPLLDGTIPLNDYIQNLEARHPARSAFATALLAPYKTRASFFTTTLGDLRLFSDPNISDMTSKQDHDIEEIGIKKTAVFLIIPDEKSTRNVLATLYIDQVYQILVELANKNGGRLPKRVNYILDEFGNLPPIPNFEKKLTVAGGRGIRFNIAIQDIAQLKKLYNKNSQTITGNCHNLIYLITADYETAKLISEKTGKYTIQTQNSGVSTQTKNVSFSSGTATTGRSLLMPDEILRWQDNKSLVLKVRKQPATFNIPDLSNYKANEDFGFANTKDIKTNKYLNNKIIQSRWEHEKARELLEPSIWIPDFKIKEDSVKEHPNNSSNNDSDDFLKTD